MLLIGALIAPYVLPRLKSCVEAMAPLYAAKRLATVAVLTSAHVASGTAYPVLGSCVLHQGAVLLLGHRLARSRQQKNAADGKEVRHIESSQLEDLMAGTPGAVAFSTTPLQHRTAVDAPLCCRTS